MGTSLSIASILLFLWLAQKLLIILTSGTRAPYPPGPKPLPVIGNVLELPLRNAARTYLEWGRRYNSDLIHASALGQHILVINSREDADALFEQRSRKYSDRPASPIVKLMGWEFNMGLLGYGEAWRFHRKLAQQNFGREAAEKYHAVATKKVHEMLRNLLATPGRFRDHYKMFSISFPMAAMYGYDVKSFEDPCVVAAQRSLNLGVYLLLPGSSYISILPILKYIPPWFPGASSRRMAAEVSSFTAEMIRIPMEFVRKRVDEGTAEPSLVSDFLEKQKSAGASAKEGEAISNVANTVYSAASDTTTSATGTFFYLMAINPDVQRKAQAEIEKVIGSRRLPTLKDRASLPYIEAIYREVMRFHPPVPLNIPHALSEDDYYKGYFIPKGTTVLGNIWAMTHDEKAYPEPFEFKPERFFDENGELNGDDRILAYGFGRRICVGKHIASSVMWLIMASVLACFDISKAKDEFGNEIEVNGEYEDFGLVTHKAKFKCYFVPRSPVTEELVSNTK
ncbi:hypothetical protein GALMADRAFT_56030 [Galerina marginata CBS 339.88]|uniref:Cytochrome P450 n=1 Tax=Galerina marginata (strain CBS 339.88) TaxID=685588 RepID=A0A067TN63_GALM3|nr:hypothetical protein GALMADRAFT_56030 [Galerina marginata CBS 339.88]